MGRRSGIPKDADPPRLRQGFRHHLQSLGSELSEQHRRARDVPARPRESGDVSQAHRVGMDREHDGNCRGRLPSRLDERRRWGEDHVHMHADELGYQRRQLIDVLRPLPFNDDVGAFDVAEVTQARPQPLTCGTLEGKAKKPDARRLRMLPMRPQRPCDRATEQSDELTPPHVWMAPA
jgi:hypothetical protein